VEAASERAALRERAGEVLEEKLSDPARALEHLVQARDLDPDRLSVLLRLERLFTTASRWRELIDTLERLAVKAAEDRERASLCSRIGALWDEKLNEPEPAIASWERTRALDAGNVPAHEALVSLYERTGRAPEFVDRSAALAELVAADPGRAVALLARAGRTAEDKLKDDDRALRLYHRAMEIDPRGIPPVAAARALFERREQWSDAVAMMLRQETITAEPEKKLELLAGAGNVYERKLADQSGAAAAYERALALKGDYLPAVAPLSEIYFDRQAWARARPLYETRVLALSGIEAEPRAEIWHKAGWCAEQAGDLPAAMKRYHASVEALGEYRPSLERLSEQYTRQEQWEQAALFTERLLAVVRLVGDPEAAFILLGRAGAIELKLNRLDRATLAFEQALQLKPGHYPTLVHLVDLYRRQEQWKKALLAYDQLIQHAPAKPAAADGLYGKGEILEDKLKEENSALAHFQKAVQVAPDHLPAWNRMARLYLRRRAWPEAETSLQNVLRLDPDKGRQVENHFQLGGVYREGLRDLARARAQFEAALQLNEVHVPSMQALGDIYLELEEWDRFIATAEKFVRIVPAESQPSLLPLYFKIGEVYRDRLQNTERSIISFQQVVKLEPGNERARSELAALYVSDPKFIDQAKSENLNLIRLQPFRVQSYRDLANIYKSQRNLDAQFWLFSILKRLGSLDLEEEMFFEANQDKALKSSKRSLKELEREGMLIHPDERGPLRDLLVQIGDFLEKIFPPALEKFGAKKSCLLDEKSVSPVKDLAIEIIGNLGLEGDLNIYLVPQAAEPTVLNTNPPSLVLSQEWLGRFTAPEQRFLMGRLIEHLIDRHALALHFPMDQVVTHLALLAMAADDNVNLTVPMPAAEADKRKKILKKLITRKNKTQIEHAAQRLTQEMLALDPNAWKKTMEHTGNRAGLIVCGDLFAAIGALMKIDPRFKNLKIDELAEPAKVWEKNEYVVEMLAFSVSDPFFRLRERGGFSITT
jgi:tetratricopeptide (TPR) repeat protein